MPEHNGGWAGTSPCCWLCPWGGACAREEGKGDGAQLEASFPLPPPSLLLSGHSFLTGSPLDPNPPCHQASRTVSPSSPEVLSCSEFSPSPRTSVDTTRSARAVLCGFVLFQQSSGAGHCVVHKHETLSSNLGHVKD